MVLGLGLALLWIPSERWKFAAVVGSGVAFGLAAWLFLHARTGGGFTEVLRLQTQRYSGKSGFELMAHYDGFREAMEARGVTSATGWNLSEHSRAFLSGAFTNGNFWLLLAAAGAPFVSSPRRPGPLRIPLLLWLLASVWFSIFVWEPIWDHYFVLYLPPLALFASITLRAVLGATRKSTRVAGLVLLAGCALLGHTQRFTDPFWYRRARTVGRTVRGKEILSFNPLIPVVADARPACGLIDPLNVYGEQAIAALDPGGPLARFRTTAADLIVCLGDDTPVVIDEYALWFLDPSLLAHLRRTPERLIFFGPDLRRRFAS